MAPGREAGYKGTVNLLAIESSCDDTAAAVLRDHTVLSSVVASQDRVHEPYGGVVPELASRAHLTSITATIETALRDAGLGLDDIDAVAATYGPGLIGSLLVGLCTAKAIAFARDIPFVAVNHLEGHLLSVQLGHEVPFPYLALLVSGGHTSLYLARAFGDYECLGATRDDAAGEAFDKVAKILGLGYPGGRSIDELARRGDPTAYTFPRARLKPGRSPRRFDFSFSGIKTAVALQVREAATTPSRCADIAASFQEAVVDMLLATTFAAAAHTGVKRLVIAGGVSANSRLRQRAASQAAAAALELVTPDLRYCTDNAAMIGLAAALRLERGQRDPLSTNARAVAALDAGARAGA